MHRCFCKMILKLSESRITSNTKGNVGLTYIYFATSWNEMETKMREKLIIKKLILLGHMYKKWDCLLSRGC